MPTRNHTRKSARVVNLSFPTFRRRLPCDLRAPLRTEFIAPRCATLLPERPGCRVLARIAHVLLDLAREDLGDADRVCDGVGGPLLSLGSFRHFRVRVARGT